MIRKWSEVFIIGGDVSGLIWTQETISRCCKRTYIGKIQNRLPLQHPPCRSVSVLRTALWCLLECWLWEPGLLAAVIMSSTERKWRGMEGQRERRERNRVLGRVPCQNQQCKRATARWIFYRLSFSKQRLKSMAKMYLKPIHFPCYPK